MRKLFRYTILPICIVLLTLSFAFGQTSKIDSVRLALEEVSYPNKVDSLFNVIFAHQIPEAEFIDVLKDYIEELEALDQHHLSLARLYAQLFEQYRYISKRELGSPYLAKAMDLCDKHGDQSKGWNLVLGDVYSRMWYVNRRERGDSKKGIELSQKSLKYYQLAKDSFKIGLAYNELGQSYSVDGQLEKAIEQYEISIPYFQTAKSEKWILRNYFSIAIELIYLERYQEAIDVLGPKLPEMKKIKHQNYYAAVGSVGEAHAFLNQFEKAKPLLDSCYAYSLRINRWNSIFNAADRFVIMYDRKGDYKKALEFTNIRNAYKDSMQFQSTDAAHIAAQKQFEELNTAQELKELEYEKELEVSKFKNLLTLLSALFLLSLLGIGFLIHKKNIKEKQAIELSNKEEEVQQVRKRLLTAVTHELRTPLTLVIGKIEMLQENGLKGEARKQSESALRNANELLDQINQLLDWNKMEAKAMTLENGVGDVTQLLRDLFKEKQESKSGKQLLWELDLNPEKLTCELDFKKLKTIIGNLLTNAAKYTPENGTIRLSLRTESDHELKISVADNGPGIAPEAVNKIFDWYYRAQTAEPEAAPGFGVGLALSRDLSRLMGGDINLDTKRGEGSTFILTVPFHRISNVQKMTTSPTGIKSDLPIQPPFVNEVEKPKVLVIEDNVELLQHLSQLLTKDYEVLTAADGDLGITLAIDEIPDIIITDLMLPGKDGLEICKDIKSNILTDHIPVVILTARTDDSTKYKGLEMRADAFLTKPFQAAELRLTLNNLLQNRRRLQLRYQMQTKETAINGETKDPFLSLLMNTIESNFEDSDFNVDDCAKKLKISRGQLFKKTKALLDSSPSHLIRHYRLDTAKNLLQNCTKSVSEIAYQCGFSSPEYFSTVYKDHFKVSPNEDRVAVM